MPEVFVSGEGLRKAVAGGRLTPVVNVQMSVEVLARLIGEPFMDREGATIRLVEVRVLWGSDAELVAKREYDYANPG